MKRLVRGLVLSHVLRRDRQDRLAVLWWLLTAGGIFFTGRSPGSFFVWKTKETVFFFVKGSLTFKMEDATDKISICILCTKCMKFILESGD